MPYLGQVPLTGNYNKLDSISSSFNGSTTTFNLTAGSVAMEPVVAPALLVSVNGVLQQPLTDYTVSGSTITFTTAPASTAVCFIIIMGGETGIGTPSDLTVTSAKLSGNLVAPGTFDMNGQELILDADADTSITASTDDQIDIKIAGADDFQFTANTFTALSGSTIAAVTLSASGNVDFNGDLDVDGTTNLDVVDIDGAVDMASTLQVDGAATFSTSLAVDNITIDGNTISTTNTNGNLIITPNGGGNVNINTDSLSVVGTEGEGPSLTLVSDESDDYGDEWRFRSNTDQSLAILNNISGSSVAQMTLTPHATVASSTTAIAGGLTVADDFQFTANTFTVLSGSTLTVASGATIANSGTATGFGGGTENAFTGVLQTNANFVDQVIFGPAVDGKSWNGLWDKSGVFSSLMLATIEDEGSNTEINIWDLTEQSSGATSTTPLATIDLSAAATPTSIAASMGYLIVGSEDGIAIIDPHSGAWAERTVGWPRTLSTSTVPALGANTVIDVGAGLSDQPRLDSRTGGPLPTFVCAFSGDSVSFSIIKDDGLVFDRAGTGKTANISNGKALVNLGYALLTTPQISTITADTPNLDVTGGAGNAGWHPTSYRAEHVDIVDDKIAMGGSTGLTLGVWHGPSPVVGMNAKINRSSNSGLMVGTCVGAWLANSKTVDLSVQANTLTENGTVPTAAVESGAELTAYGVFSSSNNLTRASDADWDVIGTGSIYSSIWFKSTGPSTTEYLLSISNSAQSIRLEIRTAVGLINFVVQGATASSQLDYAGGVEDDSAWHKADFVHVSSTERYFYIDGVQIGSSTTDTGSISSSGNLPLGIGVFGGNGSGGPATTTKLALARLSTTAPSAIQVRQMYDAEKGMFVASAECLLQSSSTDAVIDVDVDPLSGKVLVTQTDAITIFDGLVVDSKPTVNSGASEKGKLWGDLRAEQNAANAYVTAPATDQRQVNEMVRGLASDLPAGVDLGKAKAWLALKLGGAVIQGSYNVKSITKVSTGIFGVTFGVPFKGPQPDDSGTPDGSTYVVAGMSGRNGDGQLNYSGQAVKSDYMAFTHTRNPDGSDLAVTDNFVTLAWFGELENE